MRKELGLENRLVIGHIGRFQAQKNHSRLLSIFSELHKQRTDSVLVCVGDGEKMEETKALASQMGLREAVLFLGQRSDVTDLLSAFNFFLLPSLYEGFPFVLIEAQANGLKCFVSEEANPSESNLTGNVTFIPLSATDEEWAAAILKSNLSRDYSALDRVKGAGYDVSDAAELLTPKYLDMVK